MQDRLHDDVLSVLMSCLDTPVSPPERFVEDVWQRIDKEDEELRAAPAVPTPAHVQMLGESRGRVLIEQAGGIGEVQVAFAGEGSLIGAPIVDTGTLTYRGRRALFTGEIKVILSDEHGSFLGLWRGTHVGRHTGRGMSAAVHAVGMFEKISQAAPAQFRGLRGTVAFAQIQVTDAPRVSRGGEGRLTYHWRLWRLLPTDPSVPVRTGEQATHLQR